MRADMIIKNAKIFTADKDNPQAAACKEGFSFNKPSEVYFAGKEMK